MNYNGKCEYCGGAVYTCGEDAGAICTGCGSTWRVDGVPLIARLGASPSGGRPSPSGPYPPAPERAAPPRR